MVSYQEDSRQAPGEESRQAPEVENRQAPEGKSRLTWAVANTRGSAEVEGAIGNWATSRIWIKVVDSPRSFIDGRHWSWTCKEGSGTSYRTNKISRWAKLTALCLIFCVNSPLYPFEPSFCGKLFHIAPTSHCSWASLHHLFDETVFNTHLLQRQF